jgi:tetratricopeptide (TPR) repeat protein
MVVMIFSGWGAAAITLAAAMASSPLTAGGLPAPPLVRQEAQQLFEDAARRYEAGDFAAAAAHYGRLAAGGWDSAIVEHNLGNCEYRLGRLGRAILAYEKAVFLDPTGQPWRENLAFVSQQVVDRVEDGESEGPLAALAAWHGTLSPTGITMVFLAAWLTFNLALAGALFARREGWRRMAALLLSPLLGVLLLSALSLGITIHVRDRLHFGIVLAPRADLVSVPGPGGVRLTTVHEGLKVRLEEARGDWLEVVLPNGFKGWLPQEAVGIR